MNKQAKLALKGKATQHLCSATSGSCSGAVRHRAGGVRPYRP